MLNFGLDKMVAKLLFRLEHEAYSGVGEIV